MELYTVTQTITDPTEWDGSLFETQLELIQLAEEGFQSSQTVTELGHGVRLLWLSVNQPIKVRSHPKTLRYVATLFDDSHGGHFAGAAIERGRMLILPPAFDFDGCIKDGSFACKSIFVPPDQLEPYFQTLAGETLKPFDSLKIASPPASQLQWLEAWPSLVESDNLDLLTPNQRYSIQESLLDNALTMLTHALMKPNAVSEIELSGKSDRLEKARGLVRLAEDFANSNTETMLKMVDLCQATEVSERTLQYAFQTCLGISPMNYLKRHRLHRVRQELKQADPDKTTVSAIASQFGFFHFGDFSKSYKTQFGELPSKTLKLV